MSQRANWPDSRWGQFWKGLSGTGKWLVTGGGILFFALCVVAALGQGLSLRVAVFKGLRAMPQQAQKMKEEEREALARSEASELAKTVAGAKAPGKRL